MRVGRTAHIPDTGSSRRRFAQVDPPPDVFCRSTIARLPAQTPGCFSGCRDAIPPWRRYEWGWAAAAPAVTCCTSMTENGAPDEQGPAHRRADGMAEGSSIWHCVHAQLRHVASLQSVAIARRNGFRVSAGIVRVAQSTGYAISANLMAARKSFSRAGMPAHLLGVSAVAGPRSP